MRFPSRAVLLSILLLAAFPGAGTASVTICWGPDGCSSPVVVPPPSMPVPFTPQPYCFVGQPFCQPPTELSEIQLRYSGAIGLAVEGDLFVDRSIADRLAEVPFEAGGEIHLEGPPSGYSLPGPRRTSLSRLDLIGVQDQLAMGTLNDAVLTALEVGPGSAIAVSGDIVVVDAESLIQRAALYRARARLAGHETLGLSGLARSREDLGLLFSFGDGTWTLPTQDGGQRTGRYQRMSEIWLQGGLALAGSEEARKMRRDRRRARRSFLLRPGDAALDALLADLEAWASELAEAPVSLRLAGPVDYRLKLGKRRHRAKLRRTLVLEAEVNGETIRAFHRVVLKGRIHFPE
jgi:hypothetical protein